MSLWSEYKTFVYELVDLTLSNEQGDFFMAYVCAWLTFIFSATCLTSALAAVPQEFVDIREVDPSIQVEMRYATEWNFIGRAVDGYEANICYLTREAAKALALVQKDVSAQGFTLLVFDCYRPVRAVKDFLSWLKDPSDQKMKSVFYAEEVKEQLVKRGYLASRSGHSRGSTVDLTLVKSAELPATKENPLVSVLKFREDEKDCRDTKKITATGQLDMGTTYDCFSQRSGDKAVGLNKTQRQNRVILKEAMLKHGFEGYRKEWWHFTLKDEPFQDRYFDFAVAPEKE